MISPVLEEGEVTVQAYFPESRFYDYYDGSIVEPSGTSTTLNAPKDFIPLHVHGGNILPTQEPAINTEASRQNPFGLIVALDVKIPLNSF
jgi:alpha-glucosidase (family GH31 glycosyl hydrolase)